MHGAQCCSGGRQSHSTQVGPRRQGWISMHAQRVTPDVQRGFHSSFQSSRFLLSHLVHERSLGPVLSTEHGNLKLKDKELQQLQTTKSDFPILNCIQSWMIHNYLQHEDRNKVVSPFFGQVGQELELCHKFWLYFIVMKWQVPREKNLSWYIIAISKIYKVVDFSLCQLKALLKLRFQASIWHSSKLIHLVTLTKNFSIKLTKEKKI